MVGDARVKSRIPEFVSIEEEAAFWDSHDSTEFEDEFEPVEMTVARPLLHSLLIDFDGETFDRIVASARRQGIGPTKLLLKWTLEALQREDRTSQADAQRQ